MELLFQYSDGSVIDGIIDTVCRDAHVPVHVELRFEDGRCFSSQAPNGVRWTQSINTATDIPHWEVIKLPWTETEDAIEWCSAVVGLGYDWIGAANSGAHIPIRQADRHFCSEVCIAALSHCGVFGIPETLSPADLYRFIKRLLAGESLTALAPEFHYEMKEVSCEKADPEFAATGHHFAGSDSGG